MKARIGIGIATLAGLALLVGLIAYYGAGAVAEALLAAGAGGLIAVALYHLVPLTCSALAWRAVLTTVWEGPAVLFLWARLVREAVSNLLPVMQIGGEVVGARLLTFHGARNGVAGASVVVDLTFEVLTQFLFALLGVGLFVLGHKDDGAAFWLIVGLMIFLPAILGFVVAQHWGLFRLLENFLARMAEKWEWLRQIEVAGLHDAITALYRHPRAVAASCGFHLLAWVLGAGEVWLALQFMGHPVHVADALIIESLVHAVRSVGFMVPAGLGVQEGGFLLIGGALGLGPEVALALSLVKRVRDLMLGLPALAGWHFLEGRRMWRQFNGRLEAKGAGRGRQ